MSLRKLTAATLTIATAASATHARTETIAVQGQQAPGQPAGVLFGDDLGLPVINANGHVAHTSDLTGTGITTANDRAIYENTSLVVQTGDPAHGTPAGVVYATLGDPLIEDLIGRVTYYATLTGTGITTNNDQGIWRDNDVLWAREGDLVDDNPPLDPTVIFQSDAFPNTFAMNADDGSPHYKAGISGPGINSTNNSAIFSGQGNLQIQEGDVAPGTGGETFSSLGTPNVNQADQIAHTSFLRTGGAVDLSNNQGIWRDDTLVAREGSQAPGTPAGVTFTFLGQPAIALGQVVHISSLAGTGVTADNDRGIWREQTLIAREGDQAAGLPAGAIYRQLGTPVVNNLGQIAHQSSLQLGGPVNFENDAIIMRGDTVIAREGSPAGGIPGAIFDFGLGDPVLNNIGVVAHSSSVDNAGINDNGIWLSDGIEHVLAVRQGDTLQGRTVSFFNLHDPATVADGRGSPLNDRGELAYHVFFDDSTEGIFRFTPTLHWRNPANTGHWNDPQNWTLGILPASFTHDVVIDPDHDVNIQGPAIGTSTRPESLTIGGGLGIATVEFNTTTIDPATNLVTVDRNAHLILQGDANINTNNIDLGTTPATPSDQPAKLTIIGPTADIDLSDTLNVAVNAPAVLNATNGSFTFTDNLMVGINSDGTLNVLSGAGAEADASATLGQNPGSSGTIHIDGHGSNMLITPVLNAGVAGNAHINVTNGATLDADDGIDLATGPSSVSTVNVQGPTSTINAGLLFAGDQGHATVTAQDGATLNPGSTRLGISATGNGTLIVTGPGTTLNASGVEIALNGTGSVTLADGATATTNDVVLGQSPTANASLTLSGPGTTWNAGITLIGNSGSTANFRVENGAAFSATFLTTFIGNGAGSVAHATVTGPGSTFSATGPLSIATAGATGTLNLTDGGLASFAGLTTIDPGGTVHIDGGTLTTQALAGTGDIHLISGTLNITDNTTIDAKLFDPNLTLGHDTAVNVTNDATIDNLINATIDGGTLTANTLTNDGTLAIESGLVSADNRLINNAAVLLGNPVTARITTPSFENFGDLTGAGRITGDLSNSGTVDPTTGTLRVERNATNNASGIISLTGGQLRVTQSFTNATNALVIGNGTLRADGGITNQSKASMAFSGPTNILGDVTNNALGLITSAGPGPLTFFDDVTNDGEIRTNTNSFTVFLGTTSGSGSYTGTGTVVYEADFTPGSSPGINNFDGNLVLGPFATLQIEALATVTTPVADPVLGADHDQINIANELTLNGTLNVTPLPDNGPIQDTPLGNEYLAITYGTRTPSSFFHTINGTLINTAFALAPLLDESTNEFTLRATIPGDLNLDNKVSVADLSTFALNFGTTPGLYNDATNENSWQLGDFNSDGAITVADLSLLALNFGFELLPDGSTTTTPTPLSIHTLASIAGLDPASIPEPTTALILLTAAFPLATRTSPLRRLTIQIPV